MYFLKSFSGDCSDCWVVIPQFFPHSIPFFRSSCRHQAKAITQGPSSILQKPPTSPRIQKSVKARKAAAETATKVGQFVSLCLPWKGKNNAR